MIKSEFYQTELSQGDFEFTDTLDKLPKQDDLARPYYMGWLAWENVPKFIIPSYKEGEEDGIIKIRRTVNPYNAGWFYTDRYYSNVNNSILYYDGTKYTNLVSSGVPDRFINSGYLASVNITYSSASAIKTFCQIEFLLCAFSGKDASKSTYSRVNLSIEQFKKMCSGEQYPTVTFSNTQYTITGYDDEKKYFTIEGEENLVICISQIQFSVFGGNIEGSTSISYHGVYPNIKTYDLDGNPIYFSTMSFGNSSYYLSFETRSGKTTLSDPTYKINDNWFLCGLECDIDTNKFSSYNRSSKYYHEEDEEGRPYLVFTNGAYFTRVYPPLDLKDIATYAGLFLKWVQQPLNSYFSTTYNDGNYTNEYNENDMPTGKYFTEEFIKIVRYLRDWQMPLTDITVNEFDPDDIPPYTPGGDDDENPEDSGDIGLGNPDIFKRTQAFVKTYVMDFDNLTVLGADMWQGLQGYTPGESNMIDNFYLSKLTDIDNYALDFTLSNIIDYFISLRWFPLDLWVNCAYFKNAITVGTGAKPIMVSGRYETPSGLFANTLRDAGIPATNLITVNGGSLYIPESNSFTDIEPNVSASIYVPYCGTVEIQPSQIRGSTLTLKYLIDIISGSMQAIVMKSKTASFPIASLTGQIGFDIQMSGSNFNTQMIGAAIASAKQKTGILSNIIGSSGSAVGQIAAKNWVALASNVGSTALNAATDMINLQLSYPQMMGTSPISTGSASSMASLIAPQTAYVQFVRHSEKKPGEYGKTFGNVSNTYGRIGSQSGFVIVENPVLNISATQNEITEIQNLLSSGVYV